MALGLVGLNLTLISVFIQKPAILAAFMKINQAREIWGAKRSHVATPQCKIYEEYNPKISYRNDMIIIGRTYS